MKTTPSQKPPKQKPLPDTLSALIFVALADLAKAERSKKYKINMGIWHSPNSHCTICFAGGVIAFSLGGDPKEYLEPYDFDRPTMLKLLALDNVRSGEFMQAVSNMGGTYADRDKASQATADIEVPPYTKRGSAKFKKQLTKAAHALEKVGL